MRGGTPVESALSRIRYHCYAAFWASGTIVAPSCFVAGKIAALFHFVVGTIAAPSFFVAGAIVAPIRFCFRCNRCAAPFLFPAQLLRRPVFVAGTVVAPPCFCCRPCCAARPVSLPVQSSRRSFIWQTSRAAAAVFRFVSESVVYGFLSVCERGCAAAYMRCSCAMLLWV